MIDTKSINKPFKIGDIAVYALIVIVVSVLFIAVLSAKDDANDGFLVSVNGETVFSYYYLTGEAEIKNQNIAKVEKLSDGCYKIVTEKGYNVIEIDRKGKLVKVTDADCGYSKECTHMNLSNGDVICVPHGLVIKSLSEDKLVIG